jgi:hypothetical protein
MMTKMAGKVLDRKLKLERVEACLNCKKFVECENIGRFEECVDFEENEGGVWVIKETTSSAR